ncbi:MAG: hypothetical protein C4547_07325 [Phycisphaerales bacterium]|nr:MAG: hypothetical protein C4547_07325 [Phycisphaerales bacterium]
MPPEHDPRILDALRRAFADPTSNAVEFTLTARDGRFRDDEGLKNLLPTDLTREAMEGSVKAAIVQALDRGLRPTVTEEPGDSRMGLDPVTFHEFRIPVEGVRLYVKVQLNLDEPDDPTATVISVKRAD